MSDMPALGSNVSGSVKLKVFQCLEKLGCVLSRRSDSLKIATKVAEKTGWEVPTVDGTHQFFVRFLQEFGEVKQRLTAEAAQRGPLWTRGEYSYSGDSRDAREMRRNIARIAEMRQAPSVKDGQLR